ncbi:hypothetical protein J4210_01855 [Candidatus Woesearchaeota archaeon]|nr:hypothetical protein [Candidatus Woesearchaeota archaeon]
MPDDLQERMKKHSEIRWSEVVRKSISQKMEMMEMMDKIARKSKLTQRDISTISRKIKAETFEDLNRD